MELRLWSGSKKKSASRDGSKSLMRLAHILSAEPHVSDIKVIVGGDVREHCLGFMQWDSLTRNFEYTNLGLIRSLSELSAHLGNDFSD